jgi:hypothetical protein
MGAKCQCVYHVLCMHIVLFRNTAVETKYSTPMFLNWCAATIQTFLCTFNNSQSTVINVRFCSALFCHLISFWFCFFVKLLLLRYFSHVFIIITNALIQNNHLFFNFNVLFYCYSCPVVPKML